MDTENKVYKAALLVIGNEILSGRTQDKNINHIAVKLSEKGIVFAEVRIVPDVKDKVIDAVNALRSDYDYVFTTGGIGPTHDDITAECIALAFDTRLEKNKDAYAILEKHYGIAEFSPARQKMAMIPFGASLIENPVSAAPGFNIGNVYVMAGVPRIMQAMLDFVLDGLQGGAIILSRTVSCDLPESKIALDLEGVQSNYDNVEIGSYPFFQNGKVGVSLVLRSSDELSLLRAQRDVSEMVARIQKENM